MPTTSPDPQNKMTWDHSSDQNFIDYYALESLTPETVQRFTLVRDKTLWLLSKLNTDKNCIKMHVADIGCGTGTQSRLWAKLGHKVFGLDVNAPLIEIAKARAIDDGIDIQFDIGSATELPYSDASMDIALLPELLEHVADWQSCLNEGMRILKPGGLLYVSTTNYLCPIQDEFSLPLYSWYPGFLKRHYERLAITTRQEIVNYCKYPAVNWFSYYSLKAYFEHRNFRCLDRFDTLQTENIGTLNKLVVRAIRLLPPLRFVGHVFTRGSWLFAIKAH
ncbi:methyltransferase domain-containing protein [Propionivibrio sp.]|uniref:class I SAM-dependent methyltransferase n=1 Tax=Propionivibrio sp. TaxID=2212460 RepID=UPI003BF35F30